MKLNSVKRSISLIFFILFAIVMAFTIFHDLLLETIGHNPIINSVIVSMQIIGVIYVFYVCISLVMSINSWNNFTSLKSNDVEALDKYQFSGALKGLRGRVSDLVLAGPEIRSSILDELKDKFSHRVSGADYLSGLLVGLGLLGTFLGLIMTMGSITEAMMNLKNNANDIGKLLDSISGPLSGMSQAFSASFLGLMGSLVMGLLAHLLSSIVDNVYHSVDDWVKKHAEDQVSGFGGAEGATGSYSGSTGVLGSGSHGGSINAAILDAFNQFLASMNEQQPILRSIKSELETANNALNVIDQHTVKIAQNQIQTIDAIDSVHVSTEQNRTALVEAIGGMNADRLQIVTSFDEVSETLSVLQSEIRGVRQQLLTIESVARTKTSDSEAVVKAIRQQNEALIECVGQMTSIKASIQS
ncbi:MULTISPECIES: MotA/TolQ/ExbB proton channel family protein [unclassified Gilliamella]|uniref:MotA/TolQ/ExbB proton channel family protein n=1 Tax=unclassified Gilliamella TaxID=2685620 RepID=UPI001C697B21|nr:MotA/TolQ/ExbB proton channel family protein [Gilliamella sp. ESL0441]QYN44077.1 hypothetical protein GYM75_04055 [Gilliamella sp. ESL0441]